MHSERVRDPFAFLLPCRGSLQKSECLRFAYRHLNTNQRFLSLFSLLRAFSSLAFFPSNSSHPSLFLPYLLDTLLSLFPTSSLILLSLFFSFSTGLVFGIDRLIDILDQRSALDRLEANVQVYMTEEECL